MASKDYYGVLGVSLLTAIMPRIKELRRTVRSRPAGRAARTAREIASDSIASSSVSGKPSSRSWVCCAISSHQLTTCASRAREWC